MLPSCAPPGPLLLGILLLMVGNGMRGTLLGIRGKIEGISTSQMSVVMAGLFRRLPAGFAHRAGHDQKVRPCARVCGAGLADLVAADPLRRRAALDRMGGDAADDRLLLPGVYITSESWLNASTSNESRGQAMSAYMIVQMLGIISAQLLMNTADPQDICCSSSLGAGRLLVPADPAVDAARAAVLDPETDELRQAVPRLAAGLRRHLPDGGIFSALFGMASVWGSTKGLTVTEISALLSPRSISAGWCCNIRSAGCRTTATGASSCWAWRFWALSPACHLHDPAGDLGPAAGRRGGGRRCQPDLFRCCWPIPTTSLTPRTWRRPRPNFCSSTASAPWAVR